MTRIPNGRNSTAAVRVILITPAADGGRLGVVRGDHARAYRLVKAGGLRGRPLLIF